MSLATALCLLAHLAWLLHGGMEEVSISVLHGSLLPRVATGPCVRVDFLPVGAMGVPLTLSPGVSRALGANVPPLSPQLSRRAQPQGKQEEPMTNGGNEPASTKQAPCAPPTELPAAWP